MNAPHIPAAERRKPRNKKWRTWYLKQLHSWHWISAAISLAAMLLFSVTGITLNHAQSISATPEVVTKEAQLPPGALAILARSKATEGPLPPVVAGAVESAVGLDPAGKAAEWSDGEVYVALPRPGGDGWVNIERETGKITSEVTNRGWISYLNDLHKGRNTGDAWFWFIDVFAVACILFSITGVLLLQLHAKHRPSTWPIVAAGLALPVVIAIVFIH